MGVLSSATGISGSTLTINNTANAGNYATVSDVSTGTLTASGTPNTHGGGKGPRSSLDSGRHLATRCTLGPGCVSAAHTNTHTHKHISKCVRTLKQATRVAAEDKTAATTCGWPSCSLRKENLYSSPSTLWAGRSPMTLRQRAQHYAACHRIMTNEAPAMASVQTWHTSPNNKKPERNGTKQHMGPLRGRRLSRRCTVMWSHEARLAQASGLWVRSQLPWEVTTVCL